MRTYRKWTNGDFKELIRDWEADVSIHDIAKKMRTNYKSVTSLVTRLRKNGLKLKIRTRGNGSRKSWDVESLQNLLRDIQQRKKAS